MVQMSCISPHVARLRIQSVQESAHTSDFVDNQKLKSNILCEIVGTKDYVSTNGAKRTVRHIRMIPWEAWEKLGGNRPPRDK